MLDIYIDVIPQEAAKEKAEQAKVKVVDEDKNIVSPSEVLKDIVGDVPMEHIFTGEHKHRMGWYILGVC